MKYHNVHVLSLFHSQSRKPNFIAKNSVKFGTAKLPANKFIMSPARLDSLKSSLANQPKAARPILTSINGDATWLISFPRPRDNKQSHKQYYHVLTDPWLKGDTSFLSTWFIHIKRSVPTAAADGPGVDEIVREIEAAASGEQNSEGNPQGLDAILINFHYLDHMHQPTLLTFDRKLPVFAAKEAHQTVSSWGHFDRVILQHDFEPGMEGGWQSAHPGGPLPEWLTVFRLKGDRELNFATVVIWSHEDNNQVEQQKHEAVLMSPHGIKVDQPNLEALFSEACEPPLSSLAMLAALKDSFSAGMRTTLGMSGSLAMERRVKPKYWLRMHDSYLAYGGVLMWLLWTNDVFRTLDDALKQEAAAGKGESRRPNLVEVESGQHFILA